MLYCLNKTKSFGSSENISFATLISFLIRVNLFTELLNLSKISMVLLVEILFFLQSQGYFVDLPLQVSANHLWRVVLKLFLEWVFAFTPPSQRLRLIEPCLLLSKEVNVIQEVGGIPIQVPKLLSVLSELDVRRRLPHDRLKAQTFNACQV